MTPGNEAIPKYWFARSGDNWLARNSYTFVHWKGFVALFGTIFGCIGLLLAGVLLVLFVLSGEVAIESAALKWAVVGFGVTAAIIAFALAIYAFISLRKRVDPVNNASFYAKNLFGK